MKIWLVQLSGLNSKLSPTVARFDIHLDPVTYSSDEEYRELLEDPSWTKSETDQLLELAKRYELRWPVIYDRWCEHFDYYNQGTPQFRRIEDIQHRYYAVAAILLQSRVSHEANIEAQNLSKQMDPVLADGTAVDGARLAAADARLIETAAARALATAEPKHQPLIPNLGTGTTNKIPFDLKYERERREHLERLWNRSKEEEGKLAGTRYQHAKEILIRMCNRGRGSPSPRTEASRSSVTKAEKVRSTSHLQERSSFQSCNACARFISCCYRQGICYNGTYPCTRHSLLAICSSRASGSGR